MVLPESLEEMRQISSVCSSTARARIRSSRRRVEKLEKRKKKELISDIWGETGCDIWEKRESLHLERAQLDCASLARATFAETSASDAAGSEPRKRPVEGSMHGMCPAGALPLIRASESTLAVASSSAVRRTDTRGTEGW